MGTSTTYFVNQYYEVTDASTGSGQSGVVTKYYYAGCQRITIPKKHRDPLLQWTLPTQYQYTGQYSYIIPAGDTADFGLVFYCEASLWDNACWYDPYKSRSGELDGMDEEE